MTRQEQFVILVQTTVLAAASAGKVKYTSVPYLLGGAIDVAGRIPTDSSVADAAIEYCKWQLESDLKPVWSLPA